MIVFSLAMQYLDAYLWRLMNFSFFRTYEFESRVCKMHLCRQKKIRVLAFFIVLIFTVTILAGCTSNSDNVFPKVAQPKIETSSTSAVTTSGPSETPGEISDGSDVLKVAAPISNKTAQYLAKLYTAKKFGEWNKQDNGSTVSLEKLDAVKPVFSVEVLQTPSTGATEETINQWKESGFVPDIIYTDALSSLEANGDILPLSDYAATNPLFLPTKICTPMLYSCSITNELYGIPYSASAQIMYINMDVLKTAGVDTVPFNLDLNTMKTISESVRNMTTKDTPLEQQTFALYKASDLIPFLPSSFKSDAGWFMYNGTAFDFYSSAFTDAVTYLRAYVKLGYSVESLTAEDQQTAFSSLDPRLSKRVAMWVGTTAEVSLWSINHAYTLSIAQIPAENPDKESKLALTVYPLCISAQSKSPQLACDFASFIALDEDAILLATRLESVEGLLPVVSSNAVWEAVCLQQTFGEELLLLQNKVPDAYYNPVTNHNPEYLLTQQLMGEYRTQLIDDTADLQTITNMLSNTKIAT